MKPTHVSEQPKATSSRRLVVLSALAAALGLAGGGAAWALVHLIGGLTNLALFHRLSWALPSFRELHRGPNMVAMAMLGGFVVSLIASGRP